MAENKSGNTDDRQRISRNFLINRFVPRYNISSENSTQFGTISNSLYNVENTATNCSVVTVLALVGLTKKSFGHIAIVFTRGGTSV